MLLYSLSYEKHVQSTNIPRYLSSKTTANLDPFPLLVLSSIVDVFKYKVTLCAWRMVIPQRLSLSYCILWKLLQIRALYSYCSLGCADSGSHCSYWKEQGYCEKTSRYNDYMTKNCPESCGTCPVARECLYYLKSVILCIQE